MIAAMPSVLDAASFAARPHADIAEFIEEGLSSGVLDIELASLIDLAWVITHAASVKHQPLAKASSFGRSATAWRVEISPAGVHRYAHAASTWYAMLAHRVAGCDRCRRRCQEAPVGGSGLLVTIRGASLRSPSAADYAVKTTAWSIRQHFGGRLPAHDNVSFEGDTYEAVAHVAEHYRLSTEPAMVDRITQTGASYERRIGETRGRPILFLCINYQDLPAI